MNTVPQTTDIHESVRRLFDAGTGFDIREDGKAKRLEDGDPLWIDQTTSRFEPETTTEDDFFVVRAFRLSNMEQVNPGKQMGVAWWREQMGEFDFEFFGRSFPNCYVTNGEYLFVSGGLWVRVGKTTEFHAWSRIRDERVARSRIERDEWIAEHAKAVAAVQPLWADPNETVLDIAAGEVDSIEFRRELGEVVVEQMFEFQGAEADRFTPLDEPMIRVIGFTADHNVFTADQAAHISVDMVAAAAMLGAYATVSHVHDAVTASGVSYDVVLENLGV